MFLDLKIYYKYACKFKIVCSFDLINKEFWLLEEYYFLSLLLIWLDLLIKKQVSSEDSLESFGWVGRSQAWFHNSLVELFIVTSAPSVSNLILD